MNAQTQKMGDSDTYPQQLIWDQIRVERDWRVLATAVNSIKSETRDLNYEAYDRFVDSVCSEFSALGVKLTRKSKLFVPKRVAVNFDGCIRHTRTGLGNIALVIPFRDDADDWHVVSVECLSVRTIRGRGFLCFAKDTTAWKSFRFKSDAVWLVRDHAIRRCVERSPIKNYEAALGTILWAILKAKRKEGLSTRLVPQTDEDGNAGEVKASNAVYESFGNIIGTRFVIYGDRARSASERNALVVVHTWLSCDMVTIPRDLSRNKNDSYLTTSKAVYEHHVEGLDGYCTFCGKFTIGRVNLHSSNQPCPRCKRKTLFGMEALRDQGLVVFIDSVYEKYKRKFGEFT